MSSESLLISAAVFALAFGAIATTLEYIRHPPATPLITFTGIAGVYLGLYTEVEHVAWLYVPCLVPLLGAAGAQIRDSRRSEHNDDDDRPAGGIA